MDEENTTLEEPLNKNFREPKIRFPEFNKSWKKHILSEVSTRKDNLRIPVDSTRRVKGDTPYYGANGIQDYVEGYTHDGENVLIAEDGANDLINYPVSYVTGKIWVNNHCHVLQANEHYASTEFLAYVLKSLDYSKYIVGGSRSKLNADILMNMELFLPEKDEQIKITKIFNSINRLYEVSKEKFNTLKKYKEGLQKLIFSKNKFQMVSLNKLVTFQPKSKHGAGTGITSGKYPFYLSGDKVSSSNEYLCDGCYIIANDGGEANFRITNCKFLYSNHCICFKAKDDNQTNYIYNYLQSIRNKITYFGFVGSGLKNIDRDYFENLNIPIANTDEISKISNTFLTIDKMISIYEDKEEKIKQIKSRLLKSMFI